MRGCFLRLGDAVIQPLERSARNLLILKGAVDGSCGLRPFSRERGRRDRRLLRHASARWIRSRSRPTGPFSTRPRLLADFEEAETSFRGSRAGLRGRLRVDVRARIGRPGVAPALPDSFARYAANELEPGSSDRAVDLAQEGIDCVLRAGRASDALLIARPLGVLPQINCASPEYPARHGTPRETGELASHYAVHYLSPATGQLDEREVVDARGHSQRVLMQGRVTVNSAVTYLACCLAGPGLIQIPAYDVQEELRTGRLVEVMPDARAAPLPISLPCLRRRKESRRLHAFLGRMKEILPDQLKLEIGQIARHALL